MKNPAYQADNQHPFREWTDDEGLTWPDARLAFRGEQSRRNSIGAGFSVSREEMALLRDVPNSAFRLYFLLQQRESWSAGELVNQFFRDGERSRYSRKLTKYELARGLQSLWREGLVSLKADDDKHGVIHCHSRFTGNYNRVNGMIAYWVRYGPDSDISRSTLSKRERDAIYDRDGRICKKCGSQANLTIDHIYPVIRGGSSEPSNLQVLCRSCNSKKNAKLGEV